MQGGWSSLLQKLDVIILGAIALAIIALLADRWMFHRPTNESMLILLAVMIVALLLDRLIGSRATAPAPRHLPRRSRAWRYSRLLT